MLNEDAIFLGHQVFLAIYKKGDSIEAACKKAGVEVKDLLAVMNGQVDDVSFNFVKKFAKYLNLSVKDFFNFPPYNQKATKGK
ncbi:transcriptional regulator [Secundilactobacillus kimchicus]|uniref:HTH cro/C1-type domain-containing protein n=1 Tax=Secundilactobacillus kimchicus JCM 15530 TaxID=1302272 RepID=A0A0R1HXX8_9LACO|nr:transcriptional regulator [Secundilactobacillus kimchicus]KRK49427.1 hypothetical protein FC96_GL000353 [Secundilactobacillus kimchicus JCM 15530]MBT9672973.1 transcriptional regulator [Secundilactobacillus kimchicus]